MACPHVFSISRSGGRRRIVAGLASLSLALGAGSALAQTTGSVGVLGTIVGGSCSISTAPVNLGRHFASEFPSIGSPTEWVNVPITSQGCDADVVTLHMGFQGAVDTDNSGLFAVAPGGASGLGIELQTADGSVTVIPNTNLVDWMPLATGNIYAMQARYRSTSTQVTPGAANSTVTVVLSYN